VFAHRDWSWSSTTAASLMWHHRYSGGHRGGRLRKLKVHSTTLPDCVAVRDLHDHNRIDQQGVDALDRYL
jgi:hypothetical protein